MLGRSFEKSATKTWTIGEMGRKRENWEENGNLAGSLPLRTGRDVYTALFNAYIILRKVKESWTN